MNKLILPLICLISFSALAKLELDPKKWKLTVKKKNVKIYSQSIKGKDVIAFKTSANIKVDIHKTLAVLREAPQAVHWSDNLLKVEYLEEPNDLEATIYELRKFPWPFDNRDLVIKYNLRINHERKSVEVKFNSVEHPKRPKRKTRVRAKLYVGLMNLWPKSNGSTDVELVVLGDPKGSIPKWVVNLFQEELPFKYIQDLEREAKKTKLRPRPGIKKALVSYFDQYPVQSVAKLLPKK